MARREYLKGDARQRERAYSPAVKDQRRHDDLLGRTDRLPRRTGRDLSE